MMSVIAWASSKIVFYLNGLNLYSVAVLPPVKWCSYAFAVAYRFVCWPIWSIVVIIIIYSFIKTVQKGVECFNNCFEKTSKQKEKSLKLVTKTLYKRRKIDNLTVHLKLLKVLKSTFLYTVLGLYWFYDKVPKP